MLFLLPKNLDIEDYIFASLVYAQLLWLCSIVLSNNNNSLPKLLFYYLINYLFVKS